jgi:hypothetical protein
MSEPQQILQKKARLYSTNPFSEAGVLQHVLNYLGPGHWLFAALVSEDWHQAYLKVPEHQMVGVSPINPRVPVVCVPQMTLYSAAVASVTRLTLAEDVGLDLDSVEFALAAGRWADKATISLAAGAGMPSRLGMPLVIGARQSRSMSTLQWFVELSAAPRSPSGCCVWRLRRDLGLAEAARAGTHSRSFAVRCIQ